MHHHQGGLSPPSLLFCPQALRLLQRVVPLADCHAKWPGTSTECAFGISIASGRTHHFYADSVQEALAFQTVLNVIVLKQGDTFHSSLAAMSLCDLAGYRRCQYTVDGICMGAAAHAARCHPCHADNFDSLRLAPTT